MAAVTPALALLTCSRALVGLGSWAAPAASARVVGVPGAAAGADATVVLRLFGARDVALAASLRQRDPGRRRDALRLGVAVDAVDAVAGLLAARQGLSRHGVLGVPVGAAVLCALGALALREAGPAGPAGPAPG